MSNAYARSYSKTETKSSSPSQAFDESRKKTTLLKDNSWIRRAPSEDDSNPETNFGKVVLGRFKSQENLDRPPETTKAGTESQGSYVQSLTKRFSTGQDEVAKGSGASPSTDKTTISVRRPASMVETDGPKTTTSTKTTSNGKTTETTVITTRTSGLESPLKSETLTDWTSVTTTPTKGSSAVFSSKTTKTDVTPVTPVTPTKDPTDQATIVSSTKTIKTEVAAVTPPKDAGDRTTVVSSTRTVRTENVPLASSTRTVRTENVPLSPTKKSNEDRTAVVTTTKTKTEVTPATSTKDSADWTTVISSRTTRAAVTPVTPSDSTTEAYSTKTIKREESPMSAFDRTTIVSTTKTIKTEESLATPSDLYERSRTLSSPSTYSRTSYTSNSRPEDYLSNSIVSTSTKTLYSTLDRSVMEKDMCTYCRKPMNTEPKVILDDIKINCHASCFKCDVCNGPLGHLKAGDTMWVYRGTVHCERCFSITREKWRL